MRFRKIRTGQNSGSYRSPGGRLWTPKQVALYRVTKETIGGLMHPPSVGVKVTRSSGRKKMNKRLRAEAKR